MKKKIIRTVIRTRLKYQSLEAGCMNLQKWGDKYIALAESLGAERAAQRCEVPVMMGVDPEMTGWSYYELLEHNTIVNQALSLNVQFLMTGRGKRLIEAFDPKTDVLPKGEINEACIERFRNSIDDHITLVRQFPALKSKERRAHPVFGPFDAHMWHGMTGVHLAVHFKQAQMIAAGS